MPTSTATLVYKCAQGGASGIAIQAAMQSVPFPPSILEAFGLRVTSDVTVLGPPIQRTIVVHFDPTATATALAVLFEAGESGSPIGHFTVTAPGAGYVLAPIVQISSVGQTDLIQPAAGLAWLKAVGATVANGGGGYSAGSFAVVSPASPGGKPTSLTQAPSAAPAQSRPVKLTLTILAGVVTGVAIADAGTGYPGLPQVTVVDPTGAGSGAVINLSMGVDRIDVARAGRGYGSVPLVALTPAFKIMYPDTSNQGGPFANLMTTALAQATLSPVVASAPVIA
jgi:hypothetical protein